MKKAAISIQYVVILVAAVAALLVLAFSQQGISENAREIKENRDCRTSVQQNSFLRIPGRELVENINCPTQYLTIDNRKLSDTRVKKEVADKMVDCWQNFGEGNEELFRTSRGTDTTFCVVCSVINFEEKGKVHNSFVEWMSNPINKPIGLQESYLSYLTGKTGTGEFINQLNDSKEDIIDTNEKYAVMFVYDKNTGVWDKLTGITSGIPVGAVALGGAVAFAGGGFILVPAAAVIGGVALGGALGFIAPWSPEGDVRAGIARIEYNAENLRGLKCQELAAG